MATTFPPSPVYTRTRTHNARVQPSTTTTTPPRGRTHPSLTPTQRNGAKKKESGFTQARGPENQARDRDSSIQELSKRIASFVGSSSSTHTLTWPSRTLLLAQVPAGLSGDTPRVMIMVGVDRRDPTSRAAPPPVQSQYAPHCAHTQETVCTVFNHCCCCCCCCCCGGGGGEGGGGGGGAGRGGGCDGGGGGGSRHRGGG
jgi:uncharacterized membrane protein YgcG